jgi:lysophospholipase L1-like esterase
MKLVKTIRKLESGVKTTLVAIGDSLTYGWMVRKGYLDFFDEMLRKIFPNSRFQLINRGIPGDTAEGGLYRFKRDVLDFHPDCVLIQFALNDAFSGCRVADFEVSVQQMIDAVREESEVEAVLITSVYMAEERERRIADEFYRCLEYLAQANTLPLARVHAYWKAHIDEGPAFRTLVQGDLVHPTEAGYRLMAAAVMELFDDRGNPHEKN